MLTMIILVKNEEDIIEKNIRFHAKKGVDNFVIMDNNSTDSTREILEELKKEFELTIIEEKGIYSQSKWMTKLAHIAKKKYNPKFIIPNDADEFWWCEGNLKETIPNKAVTTVERYNFLLYENLSSWDKSIYRVENPIHYNKNSQLQDNNLSLVLTKLSPKVIIKPLGLIKIKGGNHRALHIFNFIDFFLHYDKIKKYEKIKVFHYPIRSFVQFKKNIENRKKLLQYNASMGPHYRRWVKLLEEGKLEEEFFNNLVFKKEEIKVLEKFNIVTKDERMKNCLNF